MGDTRDRMGNAGVAVASGAFRMALYVCVVVLIIWIGKVTYQFGYDVFNQQAMSPGEGQEVTVVVKEDDSVYDIAKTLESKGSCRGRPCILGTGKAFQLQRTDEAGNLSSQHGLYSLKDHGDPGRRRGTGRGRLVIVEERMRTFINSLDRGNTPFLEELEKTALEAEVPVIRREMQSFIKTLLALQKPEKILEVGTAVGFSTLLMCEYGPENLHITTIENYEKRIPLARENFRRAGREEQITLMEGDAGRILGEISGTYDMIFMDAAKGQYIHWLEDVLRLLKPGGILLSDNVLQEGELIQSHYLVERRDRTIYKRMREYLYVLKHDTRIITSILPLGDGAALSVKVN